MSEGTSLAVPVHLGKWNEFDADPQTCRANVHVPHHVRYGLRLPAWARGRGHAGNSELRTTEKMCTVVHLTPRVVGTPSFKVSHMIPHAHKGRSAHQIITEDIYHDEVGFCYRAASWLDLVHRNNCFAAFHYACIDARLAIEHLIFTQIVIVSGSAFTRTDYDRCVREPTKMKKMLERINPDYEKLQTFSGIILSLNHHPQMNKWNIADLMKSWGIVSCYLHWKGSPCETAENVDWQDRVVQEISAIIKPLWHKLNSAYSGSIQVSSMDPTTRQVWDDFRKGNIDEKETRIRLEQAYHGAV